jgi:hypothetical protein
MTIDCSFSWPEIRRIAGPCIKPGGPNLTERALEICSLPPGSRVADIGCGASETLEHLEQSGREGKGLYRRRNGLGSQ